MGVAEANMVPIETMFFNNGALFHVISSVLNECVCVSQNGRNETIPHSQMFLNNLLAYQNH